MPDRHGFRGHVVDDDNTDDNTPTVDDTDLTGGDGYQAGQPAEDDGPAAAGGRPGGQDDNDDTSAADDPSTGAWRGLSEGR